jgi:hypothetical protein
MGGLFGGDLRFNVGFSQGSNIHFGFSYRGGRVPNDLWVGLSLSRKKTNALDFIRAFEGFSPEDLKRQIVLHLRALGISVEPRMKEDERRRVKQRQISRKQRRDTKFFLLEYENQSDSIYDDDYIPLEDESQTSGAYGGATHFRAARAIRHGLSFTQSTLTRVLLGKLVETYSFYQSYQSAMSIYRSTKRKADIRIHDLRRAALQYLRAMMGKQYITGAIESCLAGFFSLIFGQHESLIYENQGALDGLDEVSVPMLFLSSLPFMGGKDASKGRFENALHNYRRTGGTLDKSRFLFSLYEYIEWLMEVGTQAFQKKSLKPFFHTSGSYREWYLASRDLVAKKNLMVLNCTDTSFSDYLAAVHKRIDEGEQIIVRLKGGRSPLHMTAIRLVDELRAILSAREIRELARLTKRPPFYLGLYGPPGIGKTVILDEIFAYYAALRGQAYDKSRKFSMNASDKFASGLRSDHKYFVLDDIGSINRDVDGPAAAAFIRLFMEFANVTAPATNQAALEDKGTIFARPEVVIATTNDTNYGTSGVAAFPQAFFRRLRYSLVLSVKKAYRSDPDTNQLSARKAADARTRDLHEFTVYEYVLKARSAEVGTESNMPMIQKKMLLDHVDDQQFFWWLRGAMQEHIDINYRLKEVDEELENATICGACGLLTVRCRCLQEPTEEERARLPREDEEDSVISLLPGMHPNDYETDASSLESCPDTRPRFGGDTIFKLLKRDRPEAGLHFEEQGSCASRASQSVRDIANRFAAFGHSLVDWGSFAREAWKLYHIEYGCVLEVRKLMATFITMYLVNGQDPVPQTYSTSGMTSKQVYGWLKAQGMEERLPLDYADQGLSISAMHTLLQELDRGAPRDVYRAQTQGALELTSGARNYPFASALNRLRKNVVPLEVYWQSGEGGSVSALGLVGPWVLTVGHAFPGAGPWNVVLGDVGAQQDINVTRVYPTGYYDLVVFSTPRSFKDITMFFPTRLGAVENFDVFPLFLRDHFAHPKAPGVARVQPPDAPGGAVPVLYVPTASQPGDCGSPYVVQVGNNLAIVGIHRAFVSNPLTKGRSAIATLIDKGSPLGGLELSNMLLSEAPRLLLEKNGLGQCPNRAFTPDVFHKKSYVHFRAGGLDRFPNHFRPLGTIEFGIPRMGSKLETTPLCGLVPPTDRVVPDLKPGIKNGEYVNYFNNRVDAMCDRQAHIPNELLDLATTRVTARFQRVFDAVPRLAPLSDLEALNGLDGVRFVDAFKVKTGKGLPERGPKTDLYVEIDGQRQFTEKGARTTAFVLEHLVRGVNPGIIGDFVLKDEPLKVGKDARVFTPLPAPFNHLLRRAFLLVAKVIQENSDVLGVAIGVNARSAEWADRYHRHQSFPHHVFYDFKSFDLSHSRWIMVCAHRLLMACAHTLYGRWGDIGGYPWSLVAARLLATVAHPVYNVLNTIFQAEGTLGSGVAITTLDNSLIQLIILECLWIKFHLNKRGLSVSAENVATIPSFEQHNTIDTYGDDGMVSTTEGGFNLAFFISTAEEWNLVITDPDKREVPRDVFPVEDWSFLKRGFVYKAHTEVWAPLEIKSVYKLLNLWVVPDDLPLMDAVIRRCREAAEHLAYIETQEARLLEETMHAALVSLYGTRATGEYFPLRSSILEKYSGDFHPSYARWNVVRRRFPNKTLVAGIAAWYSWQG